MIADSKAKSNEAQINPKDSNSVGIINNSKKEP
jgi:hypothetical protein